jgi:hypothetical protein
MLDVKMNEINLPWWFKAANLPYINAHARISIEQETTGSGFVPLAVSSNSPVAAEAFFVNEDNGTQLPGTNPVPICDTGNLNQQGQEVWSSATGTGSCTTPGFSFTVPTSTCSASSSCTPHLGVVVALSGDASQLTNALSTTCSGSVVTCIDSSPSLLHIQQYSTSTAGASVNTPNVGSVTLQTLSGQTLPSGAPPACADGYFSNSGAACSIGIAAKVYVGSTPNPAGLTVSATVGGGASVPLCYQTSGTFAGYWTTDPLGTAGSCGVASVPVSTTAGPNSYQVDLSVQCNKNTTPGCTANKAITISDVQRAYAANASTSGPIGVATLANTAGDANSFEICETGNTTCTYTGLTLSIALSSFIANATVGGGTPIDLHFGSQNTKSQTGFISCPNGANIAASLVSGCAGTYTINGRFPNSNDPHQASDPQGVLNCTYTNPLAGQTPSPPADCVVGANGAKTGQESHGLATLICGSTSTCTNGSFTAGGKQVYCSKNASFTDNWPNTAVALNIPPNDSRLIGMFVTPYGTFSGSGNATVPILNFAEFYVIGWNNDPCATDPTPSGNGNGNQLEVLGYFVKVITDNPNSGGTTLCNQTSFGNCVAVLTQ